MNTQHTASVSVSSPKKQVAQTTTPVTNQQKPQPPAPPAAPTWWKPSVGASWQWQLTTPVDQSVDAEVYDVDLFENSASVVSALHAKGRKVICYMETGALEPYRPDASNFPRAILGNSVVGYPEERYLDLRKLDALGPLMKARLDQCKQKGFDGIEPDIDASIFDGVDSSNPTGFPISYQNLLTYDRFIATEAHNRGLSIGLKNGITGDGRFVKDMLPYVDWTVNEECFANSECNILSEFIKAGKPVFQAEYDLSPNDFCDQANALGFSSIKKNKSLDAYRLTCR